MFQIYETQASGPTTLAHGVREVKRGRKSLHYWASVRPEDEEYEVDEGMNQIQWI